MDGDHRDGRRSSRRRRKAGAARSAPRGGGKPQSGAAAKRRLATPQGRLLRANGALLGTFVGNALGMPYEGMPPTVIPDDIEMVGGRLPLGHYTDDTEMMIALAETLVRRDVVEAEDLVASFRACFDARRGYGGGTLAVMELWESGVPVEAAAQRVFDGRGSFGNGAAMRVAPVAVRFAGDDVVVAAQARRSVRVTHAHALAGARSRRAGRWRSRTAHEVAATSSSSPSDWPRLRRRP